MNYHINVKKTDFIVDTDLKINMSSMEAGCNALGISFNGSKGNVIFFDRNDTSLSDAINKHFPANNIIIYSQLNRNHHKYDYYHIVQIASSNINDIKKIVKYNKLKAFI